MSPEEACYVRDNLFPLYFGETGEALERKLTVVRGMGMLRRLLIPFVQGWTDAAAFVEERLPGARETLYPQIDTLCGLIQSDF